MNKEVKQILKAARKQGFSYELSMRRHIPVTCPSGRVVWVARTPRMGKRSLQNIKASLRREGLELA